MKSPIFPLSHAALKMGAILLLWNTQGLGAESNQTNIPRIEFENTPLSEAIDFFRAKSIELQPTKKGINFIVDAEVDQKQLISLRLSDVPIGAAMIYMIDYADLDYRIDSHACFILPGGHGELEKRPPLPPAVTAGFGSSKKARQVILEKVEFDAAPLKIVIDYIVQKSSEELRDNSGINLVLSRRIDPDIPVSIQKENIPISLLLAAIAEITAIEIRIEKHAVFLDPPGTKILKLARIKEAQKVSRLSSNQRSQSPLGRPPNDPRSPAHPDYVKSTHPEVRKRTNSLNNVYKWVNGKWTFVKNGSEGLETSTLER